MLRAANARLDQRSPCQGARAVELQDYIAILRKRWVSILLITLLAIGAAAAATYATTPTYDSRAQIYVSVRTTGESTSDLVQGSNFTQRQVKSYIDLTTGPRVLQPVIDELGLNLSPDELAESISASSPLDTALINIDATDENPQLAADIANATAESLAAVVTELERPETGVSPVQLSTVRTATAPDEPSAPNTKLNLALGLLVGLALGVGVAVLREVLDTKVRTATDVGKVTKTSVLGTVAFDSDAPDHPLIVQSDPRSQRSEAFRRLRTNLQFLDVDSRSRAIVVTSSLPGEGKSTTTINLAITLADAGSRVLLIDADLRRPSVAKYMSIEGSVGLTTVLIGRATLQDVVQPWGTGTLNVLPSGQIPPNPSELLGSSAMTELLDVLAQHYDFIIIDTPPLLPVTDAAILARVVGGAVIVVGAEKVHRQELAESLNALGTIGTRALGVVLNRASRKHTDAYSYDYLPEQRKVTKRGAAKAKTRHVARAR